MGTERRDRQKDQHRQHQDSVRAELKRQQQRRNLIGAAAAVAVAAVIGVAAWALLGGDDTVSTASATTAVDPADPGAVQPVSDAPCPPEGGTDERVTSFDGPPQECIDPSKAYTAKVATSEGDFTVSLDAKAAPTTVNNFVVLARSHFYDGIPFHRVVPDFVGYTIAEEPPADGTYATYDLAMAKTQEPNSTGSQFFVVTGDPAPLNSLPTYSLFGTVTDGKDVVDAIGKAPVSGPSGDTPEDPVTIESITITEK